MAYRPSSWVNLQTLLDLNRGAGEEMGNRVVQNVGEQANKAQRGISSATNRFDAASDAGTLGGPDANAWNQSSNMYTADYARERSGQGYGGPGSLSDVDDKLYGQVADAVSKVKAAQDPTLSGGVISEAYNGQVGSGAGGRALDAFLMGSTSSAQLSGLGDTYGGLMDTLGAAEKSANERAAANTAKSKANAAQWAKLAPHLEEEALRQLEAKAAGERADQQRMWEIAKQQEQQYGRAGGSHEVHAIDPRLLAYQEGRGEEYDREHPVQPWEGQADYGNYNEFSSFGEPLPYGNARKQKYEQQRRQASRFGPIG